MPQHVVYGHDAPFSISFSLSLSLSLAFSRAIYNEATSKWQSHTDNINNQTHYFLSGMYHMYAHRKHRYAMR